MRTPLPSVVVVLSFLPSLFAAEPDRAAELAKLDGRVIIRGTVRENPLANMLAHDARAGLRLANQRENEAWAKVISGDQWHQFRDRRLEALRKSLGQFPPPPKDLKLRTTGSTAGDGFRIENIVFESRPGLLVTANLYRPAKPLRPMTGIILVHSHQQPKSSGFRQDMAMTWARAGCLVLVPDLVGHGERRSHPFAREQDFAKPFPPRQDYYHRYDNAMQLDLIGDSLMGWMVYDLMRCVDVLQVPPGVGKDRILLISDPAGGGDVAGVAAALEPRISGAVVTNFGGPEPESPYPLPRDAEQSFDYCGSGSWESTRNLRLSARDGFLPWLILAGIAPRKLIYTHEFYWDETDPVWKRLRKAFSLQSASERLGVASAYGFVVGSTPENAHWIARNRELLYPVLESLFDIPNPKKEYSQRLPEEKLLCLKDEKPMPLHELARRLAVDRVAAARAARAAQSNRGKQQAQLRRQWAELLGDIEPKGDPVIRMLETDEKTLTGVRIERIHLAPESGIVVPVLVLVPKSDAQRRPVVVGVSQAGNQEFLKQRSKDIADLIQGGVAVCLVDVRGTGETSPGSGRDRGAPITSISSSQLMLGQPLLGGRLRDLRAVLRLLRQRSDVDRIALWGDSSAPANPGDVNPVVPHGIDRPALAEPLGGLLALLGGLFEDDIDAIYVRGGLSGYLSAYQGPYVYLPHDVIVPAVLTVGDLNDLAEILPRPVRLDGMVDALNRPVSAEALAKLYGSSRHIILASQEPAGCWLAGQLKKR